VNLQNARCNNNYHVPIFVSWNQEFKDINMNLFMEPRPQTANSS